MDSRKDGRSMKRAENFYEENIWKIMSAVVVFMILCIGMPLKAQAEVKAYDPIIVQGYNWKYLSDEDIADMSLQVLCYGKNEIYAQHGRKFASQELQDYFNSQPWYYGTVEPGDFSESMLNEYELANVKFLAKREKELGSYKLDIAGYSYQPVKDYIAKTENKTFGGVTYESTDALSGIPYKVSVSKGYLALRSAPEYNNSNEKGQLYTGDKVFLQQGTDTQYWYVYAPKYQDYGYVNKDYLVNDSNASNTSTSSSSTPVYKTVKVDKGYLAFRQSMGFDSTNEKGQLYTGDVVEVRIGGDHTYWLVYSSKYDDVGYVNKNYLY